MGKGAYYAYCGPGCTLEKDVHPVRFETELTVLNALVAVTDDGRPRILLSAWDRIYYGECDGNCTDRASWNYGAILKHDNKKEVTGEAFALDANGNPAFILHSYVEIFGIAQEKPATHLAFCTSDCTSNAGWFANLIAAKTGRAEQPEPRARRQRQASCRLPSRRHERWGRQPRSEPNAV